MYGKNVWTSDSVYERLLKMKTTMMRERANDPGVEVITVPSFSDVIGLALAALEDHYAGLEKRNR